MKNAKKKVIRCIAWGIERPPPKVTMDDLGIAKYAFICPGFLWWWDSNLKPHFLDETKIVRFPHFVAAKLPTGMVVKEVSARAISIQRENMP